MPPKHENQSSPIDIVIYFLCVYIYKNIKHLLSQLSRIGFFKKSRNIMHMVYFRKALGTRTSKMMIPGVKYKNVQNLICLNFKFWGWLVFFFKKSRNNILSPTGGLGDDLTSIMSWVPVAETWHEAGDLASSKPSKTSKEATMRYPFLSHLHVPKLPAYSNIHRATF